MTRHRSPAFVLPGLLVLALLPQCRRESAAPGSPHAAAAGNSPQNPAEPFVDRVRLVVSGSMLGRLEPCGCAGGQLGGLPRRMQYLGEQRSYDLLVEGGDLVAGNSELDLQKAFTALTVLFGMQRPYDALGVGPRDLLLPREEWSSYASMAALVTTDLAADSADWPGVPFVEKQVRDQRVRLVSFTGSLPEGASPPDHPLTLLAPTAAWQRGLAGAAPETLRVLLLHVGDIAARKLVAGLEPKPDLVLCFDPAYTDPPAHPELVDGVPFVYPGIRGRNLVLVSLARLPSGPRAGTEVIPLAGSRTVPGGGGDPDVKQALRQHRLQVQQDGVLAKLANQRPTATGAEYVGTARCGGCHPTAQTAWQQSKHAHAWQTLVDAEADPKRYGWPVTAYPDCVGCHVVGYGERSGFVGFDRTPDLAAVGCESCHGPGSAHANSGGQVALGKVGGGQASVLCARCHDYEQSPDFLYGDRWPKIEHGREAHQQKR